MNWEQIYKTIEEKKLLQKIIKTDQKNSFSAGEKFIYFGFDFLFWLIYFFSLF